MSLGAGTSGSATCAVDHQIDVERFQSGSVSLNQNKGFPAADDESPVSGPYLFKPAAIVRIDLEQRCQGGDVFDIRDGNWCEQVVLERTFISERPMRPKPWIAIWTCVCSLFIRNCHCERSPLSRAIFTDEAVSRL